MSAKINADNEEKKRLEEYINLLTGNLLATQDQMRSMWKKKTADSPTRTERQFTDLTNAHIQFIKVFEENLKKLKGKDVNFDDIRKETEKGMANYLQSLEKTSKTPNLPVEDIQYARNMRISIGKTIVEIEKLEEQRPKAHQKPDHWFLKGLKKAFRILGNIISLGTVPLYSYIKNRQQKLVSSTLESAKLSIGELEHEKKRDADFSKIEPKFSKDDIKLFNDSPKDFIKKITDNVEKISPEEQATLIAGFLRNAKGLDKKQVGELIGKAENKLILNEYVKQFYFEKKNLSDAMRSFLGAFQIPGEGQVVDRILQPFSEEYNKQNPGVFKNNDYTDLLTISITLLNTDLHNPSVKTKMTPEQFIANFKGAVCDVEFNKTFSGRVGSKEYLAYKAEKYAEFKKDFNEKFQASSYPEMLKEIYADIKKNEIKLKTSAAPIPESSPESAPRPKPK